MTPHNLHIFNLVDPASSHMFVSVCLHSQQLSQSCCTHLITHPSHTRWLKARDVEINASSVITILTVEASIRIAATQRRAARYLGYIWYIRKRFGKPTGFLFSSLSSRIEPSMEENY